MTCLESDARSSALGQRGEIRKTAGVFECYCSFRRVCAGAEGARLECRRVSLLGASRPLAAAVVAECERDPRLVYNKLDTHSLPPTSSRSRDHLPKGFTGQLGSL